MALTPAQNIILRDHILATPELNALPNNTDGNIAVAALLNIEAAPAFTVWQTNVSTMQIMDAIHGVSLGALQTAESAILTNIGTYYSGEGFNPSIPDKRAIFDSVFTGNANQNDVTRANLLVLWKRLAKEIEALFATGTGSDADPALLVFEGSVTGSDVSIARNS